MMPMMVVMMMMIVMMMMAMMMMVMMIMMMMVMIMMSLTHSHFSLEVEDVEPGKANVAMTVENVEKKDTQHVKDDATWF